MSWILEHVNYKIVKTLSHVGWTLGWNQTCRSFVWLCIWALRRCHNRKKKPWAKGHVISVPRPTAKTRQFAHGPLMVASQGVWLGLLEVSSLEVTAMSINWGEWWWVIFSGCTCYMVSQFALPMLSLSLSVNGKLSGYMKRSQILKTHVSLGTWPLFFHNWYFEQVNNDELFGTTFEHPRKTWLTGSSGPSKYLIRVYFGILG